jgi:hypothetical protein
VYWYESRKTEHLGGPRRGCVDDTDMDLVEAE